MNAAAEAVDSQTDLIARRAVDLTYEAVPAYAAALDHRGRKHCEEDARFHVRALTGSLAVDEPDVFVDYAVWCEELLRGYGIASENLVAMFRAVGTAVGELAPEAAAGAVAHLTAAEETLGRR